MFRLTPDETIELMHEMGFKVVEGHRFWHGRNHADGQKFEHTTFRADKYSAGGAHRPTSIQFSKTPEEDSRRRDFSVNALYCDILTREILDPSGGLPDLENRVLRTRMTLKSCLRMTDCVFFGLFVLRRSFNLKSTLSPSHVHQGFAAICAIFPPNAFAMN